MAHNYLVATDQIKKEHGGKNPRCPTCGSEMFPEDDHGRFKCWTCPGLPSTNMADFGRLTLSGGGLGIQRPGETEIMRHDDPKYCIYCNEELDPGQIFECRKCDRPMCRSCWKVRGGDLCEDCST